VIAGSSKLEAAQSKRPGSFAEPFMVTALDEAE
jgi:hypothetical protein